MVHPQPWTRAVEPSALADLVRIPQGARAAGSVADALVLNDHEEQARRRACALGAVTSLALLDVLLNLPHGEPVRLGDLSDHARELVLRAPAGVVALEGQWVRRLLVPPLTVVAAVVGPTRWRTAIRRVSTFQPFAQRLVEFDAVPSPKLSWEAQVAGIGVWVRASEGTTVVCPPEPYVRRYWKAAGWRFAENAYQAATTATCPTGSSPATSDRQARTAS